MGKRQYKTIKASEPAIRRPARSLLFLFVEAENFVESSLGRPLFLDPATRIDPYLLRTMGRPADVSFTPPRASLTVGAKRIVDHFFLTGGMYLSVCLIPVSTDFSFLSAEAVCDSLQGEEKPFRQSTGLRGLADSSAQFDFVAAPQLYALSDEATLLRVYQFILNFLMRYEDRLGPLYLAFEYPSRISLAAREEWLNQLDSRQAIGFLPGVYSKKYGFLSVIPSFLAALQQHEASSGKHECLSQFHLSDDIVPVGDASEPFFARQMPVHLNFITRRYSAGDVVLIFVWGRLHAKEPQCLYGRRTEQALSEDLSRIAEPYVLEPVKESTLEEMKLDYESYLDRLVALRVLLKPKSSLQQPAYEVHLSLEEKGLETSIRADFRVTLYSEDQLVPIRAMYGGT